MGIFLIFFGIFSEFFGFFQPIKTFLMAISGVYSPVLAHSRPRGNFLLIFRCFPDFLAFFGILISIIQHSHQPPDWKCEQPVGIDPWAWLRSLYIDVDDGPYAWNWEE